MGLGSCVCCLVLVEAGVGGGGGHSEVRQPSTILRPHVPAATSVEPAEECGVSPGVQVGAEGAASGLDSKGEGLMGREGQLCYHCSIGNAGTGLQCSGLVHTVPESC